MSARRAAPARFQVEPGEGPALCCLSALISDVVPACAPALAHTAAAPKGKRRPRGEQPRTVPRSPQDVLYPEASGERA